MVSRPSLAGRNVLISGGASGFGAALAAELVRSGARVHVLDLDISGVGSLAGGGVTGATCDVRDGDAVMLAARSSESGIGPADIVICNAATDMTAEAHVFAPADWSRILDTNLKGAAHMVAAAYPGMVARGRGHFVFISSGAARLGFPMGLPYATSKAGLDGLARTLRAEAEPKGVAVSLVTLPFLDGGLACRPLAAPGVDRAAYLRSVPGRRHPVDRIARRVADAIARRSRDIVLPRRMALAYWAVDVVPALGTLIRRRLVANYRAVGTTGRTRHR